VALGTLAEVVIVHGSSAKQCGYCW